MKVDYIIVGLGLAGLAFCEQLIKGNKTFVVFEDSSQNATLVAGGVYNPVILKRFTPVWNAKEQLELALPFYNSIAERLKTSLDYKFATRKVFKSIEDQNNWFIALDKQQTAEFMNPKIIVEEIDGVLGDFGFGEVHGTGRIDTHQLVKSYRGFLEKKKCIQFEKFEYDKIQFIEDSIRYKNIEAQRIVFCEGFGLKQNPFFNYLPLNEAKGETITIHAPNLKIDFHMKSTLFVLPLGNDLYRVGATFDWSDKTSDPTKEGKKELVEKLKKTIDVPYIITNHNAGIRPTVKDRRPMVGLHSEHPELVVLNGLGTRGVMIAPTIAKQLFNHLEKDQKLDSETDIKRFHE